MGDVLNDRNKVVLFHYICQLLPGETQNEFDRIAAGMLTGGIIILIAINFDNLILQIPLKHLPSSVHKLEGQCGLTGHHMTLYTCHMMGNCRTHSSEVVKEQLRAQVLLIAALELSSSSQRRTRKAIKVCLVGWLVEI